MCELLAYKETSWSLDEWDDWMMPHLLGMSSILSPVLFPDLIRDLLGSFKFSTLVSAYAGESTFDCGGCNKDDVEA